MAFENTHNNAHALQKGSSNAHAGQNPQNPAKTPTIMPTLYKKAALTPTQGKTRKTPQKPPQ
ncbi:hypothetical protein HPHPA4_1605 [Helicobacter pylori Hp A-4]|nr:hypothetical protein HPHPA4_1605 [Helicobacter pylori Hp A-4]